MRSRLDQVPYTQDSVGLDAVMDSRRYRGVASANGKKAC
jgi:hypothetical protein